MVVMVGACTPPVPTPENDANICGLAGWHGIMPGKTDIDKATKILKDISFIDAGTIAQIPERATNREPSIVWQQKGMPARRHGLMQIQNGIVISVQAPVPTEVLLSQAITECGTPSLVRASFDGESPFHWYQFFYPEKGLIVVGRLEREQVDRAVIGPGIRIIETIYFQPMDLVTYLKDVQNFVSNEAAQAYANEFIPWPGFNSSIPAYQF